MHVINKYGIMNTYGNKRIKKFMILCSVISFAVTDSYLHQDQWSIQYDRELIWKMQLVLHKTGIYICTLILYK